MSSSDTRHQGGDRNHAAGLLLVLREEWGLSEHHVLPQPVALGAARDLAVDGPRWRPNSTSACPAAFRLWIHWGSCFMPPADPVTT